MLGTEQSLCALGWCQPWHCMCPDPQAELLEGAGVGHTRTQTLNPSSVVDETFCVYAVRARCYGHAHLFLRRHKSHTGVRLYNSCIKAGEFVCTDVSKHAALSSRYLLENMLEPQGIRNPNQNMNRKLSAEHEQQAGRANGGVPGSGLY